MNQKKACTRCGEEKALDGFSPMKHGRLGRASWCRVCCRIYAVRKATSRRSTKDYKEVTEKTCTLCLVTKKSNLFFKRTSSSDGLESQCRVCHTQSDAKSKRKLRLDLVLGYGGKCECCSESRIEFLQLDHKFNDGAEERRLMSRNPKDKSNAIYKLHRRLRRQGFPRDRYQLLCANCNWAKGMYGLCPHEKERRQCQQSPLPEPVDTL